MAVTQITSAYGSVAHGAVNWDTQLRIDIANYLSTINQLVGASSGISYAGTMADHSSAFASTVMKAGNVGILQLGIIPGSAGIPAGTANTVVGSVPSSPVSYAPKNSIGFVCMAFTGGTPAYNGATAHMTLEPNGAITCRWASVALNNLVTGAVAFQLP